jgi:hypothetical protein
MPWHVSAANKVVRRLGLYITGCQSPRIQPEAIVLKIVRLTRFTPRLSAGNGAIRSHSVSVSLSYCIDPSRESRLGYQKIPRRPSDDDDDNDDDNDSS